MSTDFGDLVAMLCSLAGMIMEDTSAIAVTATSTDREAWLKTMQSHADDVRLLLAAAEVVHRHRP